MPPPDPSRGAGPRHGAPAVGDDVTDELPVVHPATSHRRPAEPGSRAGRDRADATPPVAGPDDDGASVAAQPAPTGRRRRRVAAPVIGGHGHGHDARPAGRRVRILIAALLIPCALATLIGVVLLWPGGPTPAAPATAQDPVQGEITAARATDCSPGSGEGGCAALVVRMADGPLPGRDLVQVVPVEPGTPTFGVGDDIVLGYSGGDPTDPGSYQVVDFQRGGALVWLTVLFAAAVVVLGRWRGLAALGALVLSFGVLLVFVLPAILAGGNPLAVAVVGSCLIMFAVLYLTHGPSARTSTAVLGTLASLALIGVLGALFSAAARLTGLDDQTTTLIASLGTGVDARGLLLAGVVIGALGVLDDVTVTQTSAVWELRRADPTMSPAGLFTAAMRIGRDHVASAVNTLVLAYAGASLPLLLLFSLSGQGLGDVATSQAVATEIVRTLVGSIGLVASVPITTALAAVVASRETPEALRI
ncbi:YibE/F family protein [Pseudonocardia saturnea]